MSEPGSAAEPRRQITQRLIVVPSDAPQAEQTRAQLEEIEKLHQLLDLARELGSVFSLDLLIAAIVARTSRIMNCERSSVLLVDAVTQELVALVAQGLDTRDIRMPLGTGLAGHVASTGQTLNVPDAYQDARFNPEVDRRTGFRTHAILTMPLRDHKGQVLGVIQCLNKRTPGGAYAAFGPTDETFLAALSGICASFLENAVLLAQMDKVFEATVSAFSRAIDDRDICTSGHTRRVTLYALNLARTVHECTAPAFEKIQYTRQRLRQLRYAALLHDVGKIGVREHVLNKAEKLPPRAPDVIRLRLDVLREQQRGEVLARACREGGDPEPLLQSDYEPLAKVLAEAQALVQLRNGPQPVPAADFERLAGLKARGWITEEECACLSIPSGTLNAEELKDMRSHVVKTRDMLLCIPWPEELRDVPQVAGEHHERGDGSGYPDGLKAAAIHFDAQVLAVADVYDALTAADRPYKKAMPAAVARRILLDEEAVQRQRFMPELVQLFFDAECNHLDPAELRAAEMGRLTTGVMQLHARPPRKSP